ncbi:MAG: polysaccharide deacetylase family protein [Clostridiales bacterium]|nr:polysaccharide deacetylase family protein [Clostridiales bacterium]
MIIKIKKRIIALSLAVILLICTIFYACKDIKIPCYASLGDNLPIIMYHQIIKNENLASEYVLPLSVLESDFKYIKEKGYNAISIADLVAFANGEKNLPEKPIIITFDDGQESFKEYVIPLLEKYDLCAVVSIIGSATDKFTKTADHNLKYSHLTWEQIEEISKNPRVEIGNHTYDMHKNDGGRKGCNIIKGENVDIYKEKLTDDLKKLQDTIKEHTGNEPIVIAYPYGEHCQATNQVIEKLGFKASLTCAQTQNHLQEGTQWLFNLGRFNRAYGKSSEDFFAKIL